MSELSPFEALRVHLDWIQYRANFREPVSVRRATDESGRPLTLAELAVDLRRADPATWATTLADALGTMAPFAEPPVGDVEIQPFNWPKGAWGGEQRNYIERADEETRLSLMADWGGTTTARGSCRA